jgi:RNA polymerase sigma-70 factor (ECF subfamily)
MDRFTFDDDYVRRLREHDARTEEHFANYFCPRLFNHLRPHVRSADAVNEIRQETLTRVLQAIYASKIHKGGALYGFVFAVSDNVLLEHYRKIARTDQLDDAHHERSYDAHYIDELITREKQLRVRRLLDELKPKDAKVLRALFIDDEPRKEVCRKFGVTSANLRVLLHRALLRFREKFPPDDETKQD